ncbi:MAG: hypothetical protein IPP31_09885 [Chitinophagaceae bacterium]|nr:hypothetical protein [Chitinophagaceae bacterium]
MLQKYIALWGWGCLETFVDIRRTTGPTWIPYRATGVQDHGIPFSVLRG